MNTTLLTFNVTPSNPQQPLGIEIWFDEFQLLDIHRLTSQQSVECSFDDDIDRLHKLTIIIKNKTANHTIINNNEIVSDSLINIDNFKLDNIDIDQLVSKLAVYAHDYNGSGSCVNDLFFNSAGCNGSITLEFASPSYIWLLENM